MFNGLDLVLCMLVAYSLLCIFLLSRRVTDLERVIWKDGPDE